MSTAPAWLKSIVAAFWVAQLAAFSPPARGAAAADFPFGVYDKAELAPGSAEWRAHYAKVFAVLKDNNINTIVARDYKNVDDTLMLFDEAQRNDVRVVMTVGNPWNKNWDYAGPGYPFDRAYRHPSVIAYKYGDEPKDVKDLQALSDAYAALRQHYHRPVVTAVIGEEMNFSDGDVAIDSWQTLHSNIRFARFYPIRRTYDLVHWYPEKMKMPFASWAQNMEASSLKPWWYIAQTFGSGFDKSDASYWRLPTSNELSAMVHVALAYGARGIVGYSLQDHENALALIDSNFKPHQARDGSTPLSRYRELAALVHAHHALLLRHERADLEISTSAAPQILAVPRYDPATGSRYVYAVNQDAEQPVAFDLQLPARSGIETAQDIYSNDAPVRGALRDSKTVFHLTLEPGGGGFFRLEGKQPP